jgi:tetratricopeptide (TPR) repeat protein
MSRGFRVLVVVSILIVAVALAAVQIREGVHGVTPVFGLVLLVLGAAGLTLHLTLSDDILRRHSGEPGADPRREFWRSGWVGVVLGAALLGMHHLDRWIQATAADAQFRAAYNRGLTAARARDWQTAAEAFSEAIRHNPGDARPYRQRGAAYLHQEEPDRALADFDEALRLAPDDARVVYNRGVAWFKKQDYDRALIDFGEAIRLDPNYARAYLARGRVYSKKGDDVRARADQQKAAELDPALEKPEGGGL